MTILFKYDAKCFCVQRNCKQLLTIPVASTKQSVSKIPLFVRTPVTLRSLSVNTSSIVHCSIICTPENAQSFKLYIIDIITELLFGNDDTHRDDRH